MTRRPFTIPDTATRSLGEKNAESFWSDRPDLKRPDALLFDLDGVIADVSQSYRACVVKTAAVYGVTINEADISSAKQAGNANNDWKLTQKLLSSRGIEVDLNEIISLYQQFYEGSGVEPGLRDREELLIDPDVLVHLASSFRTAIVTGRPRKEADYFLAHFQITEHFERVIAMEDAPSKPDPAGVRLAVQHLESMHPWMIGDTPDDMKAATGAGAKAIGVVHPADIDMASALRDSGAEILISTVNELSRILS